jgi:rhodanese-related sulfurtransferase
MRKIIVFWVVFLLITGAATLATSSVSYIDRDRFMQYLEEKRPVCMVDIQEKNDYLRHHFYGALSTNAYPVKSEQDKIRLESIITEVKKTNNPVVIIGPRGTYASERAYTFLVAQGIASQRLAILKKGIHGWPDPGLLLNTYGQ